MTSPVGVIGLAYDGYDLQRSDLNVMFAITEGLDELPVVRGADDIIPFRAGRLPQKRTADHRPIVATGWIAGAAPSPQLSYRAYLDGLKTVLDPTREASVLQATLPGGEVRWTTAVARSVIGGDPIGYEFRPLSIEWEALDPFWYRTWGAWTLDSGLFLDTGLALDEGSQIVVLPTTDPFLVAVNTLGSADVTKVHVEIVGPSYGPVTVTSLSADDVPAFTYPALAVGQTLIVDSGLRTVTLNGVAARGGLTLGDGNQNGEYLRLRAGTNSIRITGRPSQVRLSFPVTYL